MRYVRPGSSAVNNTIAEYVVIRDRMDALALLQGMIRDAEKDGAFPRLCELVALQDWISTANLSEPGYW